MVNIKLKLKYKYKNVDIINISNFNNKLKVALCVSGRIDDDMEKIYISWKKYLLDYYNVDIFMNINETNNYINDIIKPVKCVVFNKKLNNDNLLNSNANIMYYRIYECNKYSIEYENKHNFKYDIIIRLRSDIILKDNLFLSNFIDDYVYFPIYKDKIDITNSFGFGLCDQMFISKRESMNKICNIYFDLNKDYLKYITCNIPEFFLYYYSINNKIKFTFFYYKFIINLYDKKNIVSTLKLFKKIVFFFNKNCYINPLK
jgi:hypothetical protein